MLTENELFELWMSGEEIDPISTDQTTFEKFQEMMGAEDLD